jgi:hypothetical protein
MGIRRARMVVVAVLVAMTLLGTALAPAGASTGPSGGGGGGRFRPGAPGVGDDHFPLHGNGGYDVRHYLLRVSYDPATDRLVGVATISARATQNLSWFNLDFVGLTVRSIKVNGRPAGRGPSTSSRSRPGTAWRWAGASPPWPATTASRSPSSWCSAPASPSRPGSSTPAGGNGTIPQFIRLAERVSGEQLDDLFRVWLFTGAKPVLEGATAAATARATATSPSAAATLERARGGQRLRH